MKAYSYARYSSDAQNKGTSIERQQSMAREWCKENGIELSTETYEDKAVSGFDGSNLGGNLGEFIADVEGKKIERGSYLVVENLDRLTRMDLWEAVALLTRLVKSLGIIVVTLTPTPQRFDDSKTSNDLMRAIFQMEMAHEESNKKSRWGKREWAKRFKAARETGKDIGKRVSNWLTLEHKGGKYLLNEHIFAVGRIFELCLDGHGSTVIAQTMNAEGYRTFNKGERWGTTEVLTVLQNRAAIGELQPKDGGEPIPNYFPPVVHLDTFDAAQAKIRARKTGAVTKQSADFNVWSKLVFCGVCGSPMHIILRNHRYLMCANRRYGTCEGSKNVRLDESEDIFMAMLLDLDAMGLVKPDPERLQRELSVIEGRLLEEERKLAIWAEKLALHPESPTYNNFVLQSEGRISAWKREVERLTSELVGGEKLNWAELQAKLDLTDKTIRKRANAYLQRLGVQVHIAEGYLVVQKDEARAVFAVAKNKIGAMVLDGGKGEIPNTEQANAIATGVKKLLLKPGGGFVYRGPLTVPNGRGTRRSKKEA